MFAVAAELWASRIPFPKNRQFVPVHSKLILAFNSGEKYCQAGALFIVPLGVNVPLEAQAPLEMTKPMLAIVPLLQLAGAVPAFEFVNGLFGSAEKVAVRAIAAPSARKVTPVNVCEVAPTLPTAAEGAVPMMFAPLRVSVPQGGLLANVTVTSAV